jgi:hypothetical protein
MKAIAIPQETRDEVRQLCDLLREAICARSGSSAMAEMRGYLEALCVDEAELAVTDLYGILRALKIPPGRFFLEVMRDREAAGLRPLHESRISVP